MKSANPIRVVDLGRGMPAAIAVRLLRQLGAEVERFEPASGDPFYGIHPAYRPWHSGSTLHVGVEGLDAALAAADMVLLGGEDYPGYAWNFDADAIAARFPRLIVVEISGYATDDARARPAVDLLVQGRTGFAASEKPDRLLLQAMPMPSYGAALTAVLGAQAARLERARTGRGQLVRASLQQGCGVFTSGVWSDAARPDRDFAVGTPKGARQPIFRCAEDKYLGIIFGTPGSIHTVYKTLNVPIETDPNDRYFPDIRRGIDNYFCERHIIEPAIAHRDRQQVLEGLWKGGVAAEAALAAGEVWDTEQVRANGTLEATADGTQVVGCPMRFRSVPAAGERPPRRQPADRRGPLAGLRIVDLGSFVAGPYGSKLLADLGADVVKLESVGGDAFRFMYKNFSSVTRGKRSLALDLKHPAGLDVLYRLVGNADVVAHNMRIGVPERNGFDPATLRRHNPHLVTLHSSAYGLSGPKALNSGFDPVLQLFSGHAVCSGGVGNDPMIYSLPALDYGTGAIAAIAILEAIARRDRDNCAVEVNLNLLDTGLFLMSELIRGADGRFRGAPLINASQTGFHPAEQLYRAADGWIAVAARSEAMAQSLASVLGLNLGPRKQWAANEAQRIGERIAGRQLRELSAALAQAGVWAEACSADAWRDLTANASARRVGLVAETDDAHYGRLSAVGQVVSLSAHPADGQLPPSPRVGEHSRQILAEIGCTAAEIESLIQREIISG